MAGRGRWCRTVRMMRRVHSLLFFPTEWWVDVGWPWDPAEGESGSDDSGDSASSARTGAAMQPRAVFRRIGSRLAGLASRASKRLPG